MKSHPTTLKSMRLRVLALLVIALFGMAASPVQGQELPPKQAPPQELVDDSEETVTSGEALFNKLRQGGITVVLLLGVSVFGAACTLERLVHLRPGRVAPRSLARKLDQLSAESKHEELSKAASASNSTLGRVVSAMSRHRDLAMPELSTLAGDVASREMRVHLLRAYPLMICATISPLLGLFGTVAGMIGAFDKVAAAGSLGDASMLGGDISKALITTAAGLVVAMPTLALYHYFRSRTNLLAIVLEEQVSEVLTHWKPGNNPETESVG